MNTTASTNEQRWLNPEVLKWAREWRGRTLEDAATRTKQDVRIVEAWESGEKIPTVKQARKLADFYDRPFLELLLPHPPKLPEPVSLPDYRMHRDAQPPSQDWELRHIQQWAETQRINAIDLYSEIGEQPPDVPQTLHARLSDKPSAIAARSREILGFSIESQVEMTKAEAEKFPGILRQLFESIGVLTLKHTELAKLKVRGICIAEFPVPTIVFTTESPAAQAFSLAHEFAHVLIKRSGVSGDVDQRTEPEGVEDWCNRYAGAFLMPETYLRQLLGAPPTRPENHIEDAKLSALAKQMRVSPHAMLIRLVYLGYVNRAYYWNVKRAEFHEQEGAYTGGGRSTYYGSRYRARQGDLYTGLVLEAWSLGRITNHNAAQFMGIRKLQHLEAVRDHFGDA